MPAAAFKAKSNSVWERNWGHADHAGSESQGAAAPRKASPSLTSEGGVPGARVGAAFSAPLNPWQTG